MNDSNILYGKPIALEKEEALKKEIEELSKIYHVAPKIYTIIVGNRKDSELYITKKEEAAKRLGITCKVVRLEENVSEEHLLDIIDEINSAFYVNGILVQLPLPAHINEHKILSAISPEKDVDGFNPYNIGLLHSSSDVSGRIPCTAQGIIDLIKSTGVPIEGKKAVVLGRSNIVGRPVARLLERENATVTVCHSKTMLSEMVDELRRADIIVTAIGKPKLITRGMLGFDQIIIDAGINHDENGKLCGDVDFENVKTLAKYITPVPGGVGPLTIINLMKNVVDNYKRHNMQNNNVN